ncbi:DUF5017 domain-containing protein [Sphingobacterium sp. SGG-5]|uniref:DUF5017 domain-containing protein n=1 Tax=Sphingobacterium sp. SGG-5 TaxID=2710881 RepID=UPI0013ECDEE5|nr:DUF5017 domain-containing protein [Sphingobacterium sp. SGG-5]NGM61271.1 DUF5017 domain-containing protein [Sphingobacterium sp. SGG-5]
MKKNILLLIAGIFLLGACGKSDGLPDSELPPEDEEEIVPDFDVELVSGAYKAGDEVTFKFSGQDVDEISFYSGEFLHTYEFHATDRISKSNSIVASFRTNIEHGANPRQPDQVSVFVSTDYNGGGTFADVDAATWKGKEDFSTWFALAPHDNLWNQTDYLSGNIELIDAFEENKPLYLAFRYQNKKNTGEGGVGYARRWFAYSFNLTSTLLSETNPLYTDYLGFSFVYGDAFDNDELKTSLVSTSGALMEMKLPVALRQVETELWAISPAINLEKVNHGPDTPKATVKEVEADMPKNYTYTFAEAGTYKVSFVYKEGEVEKVKHIDLTIAE